jgi:hypothetical protein
LESKKKKRGKRVIAFEFKVQGSDF